MRGSFFRLILLHCFFFFSPLVPAYCLDQLHTFLHGRLCEEGPFLEFLQDTGTFVFLFEASDCTINRFIFVDDDSYQVISPPTIWRLLINQLIVNSRSISLFRSFRTAPRWNCRRSMSFLLMSPFPYRPNRYGKWKNRHCRPFQGNS